MRSRTTQVCNQLADWQEISLARPTNTVEASIHRAIINADIGELRVLLGETSGSLRTSDLLIAKRALATMESIGAQDSALLAGRYGVDFANKIAHAFGRAEHNLCHVARHFGSAGRAFAQIQRAVDAA